MTRYIDAEALLNELPDDLPYKASVKRVLMQAPTADVVPRMHGESFYFELKRAREGVEHFVREYEAAVARKIFEELETVLGYSVYPRINANKTITTTRSKDLHIRADDYNAIKKKYESGEGG